MISELPQFKVFKSLLSLWSTYLYLSLCSWTASELKKTKTYFFYSLHIPLMPEISSTETGLQDTIKLMANCMENSKNCTSSKWSCDFYIFYHGFVISFVLGHRSMRFQCKKGWLSIFCNLSFVIVTAIQYMLYSDCSIHRSFHYLVYLSLLSFQNILIMSQTAS